MADVSSYISAATDVVTALATCVAVWIAWSGVDQWQRETLGKRRTELAEEMLADFYQARAIIRSARFPGSFEGEGKTRKRGEKETDSESRLFDSYYTVVERLNGQSSFFAQLFPVNIVSLLFSERRQRDCTMSCTAFGEIYLVP